MKHSGRSKHAGKKTRPSPRPPLKWNGKCVTANLRRRRKAAIERERALNRIATVASQLKFGPASLFRRIEKQQH